MNKTPKLRFKEFSEDWESKKFNSIIKETRLGGNYVNTENKTDYPLIKMGNIARGKIDLGKIEYIPKNEIIDENDKLKHGDLLFNTRNTLDLVGKVSVWKDELTLAYYNSNLMKLTFDKKFIGNNYFMNYLFNTRTVLSRLKAIATGTTSVAAIYTRDLQNIKLEFPKIEEQEKIASFLSLIDDKISLQSEKVEILKDYKKGMMQKIFSRELRFKDDDGRDYPDWEEKKLGNYIAEYKEKTTKNNQYPVLTSARQGIVLQKDYFKDRQVTTDDNIGYHIIPRGYVTYRSRSDDTTFKFNQNNIISMGIVSYFYPVFKFNENLNTGYALTYMNNYLGYQIKKEIVGTSQLVLSLNKLKSLKIQVPNIEEQNKIGDILGFLDSKINKEQEKLDCLNEYKKGLLQQMFV